MSWFTQQAGPNTCLVPKQYVYNRYVYVTKGGIIESKAHVMLIEDRAVVVGACRIHYYFIQTHSYLLFHIGRHLFIYLFI